MSTAVLVAHIAAVLPVLAAILAVRAVNVRRVARVRQVPLPLVALVFAVVAAVLLYRFQSFVDGLLAWVFAHLPFLAALYSPAWLYIAENTAVLAAFVGVKLVARATTARLMRGGDFPGSGLLVGLYEFDPDDALWFVHRHLGDLRLLLRVVFWASVVLTLAVIFAVVSFPHWPGFAAIAYPAIPVLVLGECLFAVDGLTRPEFLRDVVGEADDAHRITRYGPLRRVLAEVFGDRMLAARLNAVSSDAGETHDRLDALLHSVDEIDRVAGAYFQRIKLAGERLDANLVDAAVGVMHGSSVLIANPFYPDLTRYLAFPAYYHLLQYRKVLVVAGRDAIADDLVDWLRDGLQAITGVPGLWDVGVVGRNGRDGLDVGVLRFADLHDLGLLANNDGFFAEVGYVVLAEPAQMLATGQLGLGLALSRCGGDAVPAFAAFDRNHDGLVDALSHLTRTSITEVVASALPAGMSLGAVWRPDGANMTAAIVPRVTRYLGMGTEIAAVALKNQVSTVTWVGAERFPVVDMAWIAGQYYQQITAFAELELTQQALAAALVPWSNPWSLTQQDNRFLVVEDEFQNAYESIRLYATRARGQGFVNLIADDYLLRDYMVDNAEIFAADAKAIPSIVPDYARTERNAVLRLVLALRAFAVPAESIAKELELAGVRIPDAPSTPEPGTAADPPAVTALTVLIPKHTGVHIPLVAAGESTYRIDEGADLGAAGALLPAYFFVEDELEHENPIGALLAGHVHQALLPGQFVTYAGKYYEVQRIGSTAYRGGVVLRRAAEHIDDRRVYRQLRRFGLAGLTTADTAGAARVIGEAELVRSFADLTVETDGYIESPSRSQLASGRVVGVPGIPIRRHPHKAVLQLRLPNVAPEVRQTIAVLLNELFVTVFPHAHQYVAALTAPTGGELDARLPGLAVEGDLPESTIVVVEDSLIDLGLVVAVERNWERLLGIITDYLDWKAGRDAAGESLAAAPVIEAAPIAVQYEPVAEEEPADVSQ